jgi:acetyltransferase-like isoleucine patch superfamily enzyme
MFSKLVNQFKKSERIDLGGILFFSLDLFRRNIKTPLFNQIVHLFFYMKGIKLGKKTVFNGVPIINRYPNSSIRIGDGCKFNSTKYSISIGLNQPCAFVTMEKNAEIVIGNNSGASGLKIAARSKVTIGNNVLIGSGCSIIDNDAHHSNLDKRSQNIIPKRPINIGDNVFIGMECVILKGVTIGKNAVIGARSVVFSDIPENSIALGNPCKVIIKKS